MIQCCVSLKYGVCHLVDLEGSYPETPIPEAISKIEEDRSLVDYLEFEYEDGRTMTFYDP